MLKLFLWDGIIRKTLQDNVPQLLIDIVSLLVYIIAITIIIGAVFKQPLTGFWATSGVVAIVIGLALRNIILDLFTGVAVNIEQPYSIGDWIQIHQRNPEQNITGKVMEINWRATRVKTEENSTVIIPNSIMSTMLVTNFYSPSSETRMEVIFCIDFSIPVERVRRVLFAAAQEAQINPGFVKHRPVEVLVKRTTEIGVEYKIRYWIYSWKDTSPSRSEDKINSAVLKHLRTAGISLAYPKEDIYYEQMPIRHFDVASISDRKNIVAGVELFSCLAEKDIEYLAGEMRYFVFKAGEPIVESGDFGDSMYILVEGVADVFIIDNGKKVKVSQLYPGQFFGEMSLLTGEPRSADVVAVTDLVVYELRREHLHQIFSDFPDFVEQISSMLVERKYRNAQILNEMKEQSATVSTMNKNALVERIRSLFKKTKQPEESVKDW